MSRKETLRLYFAFAASLSGPKGTGIDNGSSSTLAAVPWFVNMTLAVLFISIAIRFEQLLPKPAWIKVVLAVSMVWTPISFAVSLRSGVQVSSVTNLILSLLVCGYLLKNITRLSTEIAPENR